ncbi:MAG: helicase-related protein [Methanothrix sp.]|nr:helicase-related protein [Methanothrix sp.]
MARLEELTPGAMVKGILPDGLITVIQAKWHGSNVVELTYKDSSGSPRCELLYRDREPILEIASTGLPWSFDADGKLFRLVSEARRIRMAYLFDPLLAVNTSLVDPLPHQITAVYAEMLTRQPLRFLLADDPGAGKTIMAGLLIKELLVRGDLHRCLICAPGSLVEQWQDELGSRFHLPFDIITKETVEASRSGNPFAEKNLAIMRLDHVSRNDELQAKLEQTDWDLIICDEAHKMSATFFGGEVKYTRRYHLGKLLSRLTRHFLLLTATPHNGKPEDFQLFMALLDGDRFEGKFRDGVHSVDVSDLMRRMVKEDLLKFDGKRLFPERLAYTVNYSLTSIEADLYARVTDYVREEFNRADALENEGRKGTVGFALTTLQRRLASSPEAIYQSLLRRKERLEKRLREEKLLKRGSEARIEAAKDLPSLTEEEMEDLEDSPDLEIEKTEEKVTDQATASQTIAELEKEISTLRDLEILARKVRASGKDRKWDELSKLLDNNPEMFDAHGHRRKLVIFTEFRDTLNYLSERIRNQLGHPEFVTTIYGGMGREDRKKAKEAFTQDKDILILVATDAAGEGINLQRAHLMINYDLPWNPNRLEQRFGRIHRIGQTEICHLWNLVAAETREGEVYNLLLRKLEEESLALGGKVFNILGKVTFENKSLRELLIKAIRKGESPEARAWLNQVVDNALDKQQLIALIEEHALVHDSMDVSQVMRIKEDMERALARRLQPHFIASFFLEAFKLLGGSIREREPKRYEISHVPAVIRNRDRMIGTGEAVLTRYERICFEKEMINVPGKPLSAFICPGHPLLDAVIDIILERYRDLLKNGAVLIDPSDPGEKAKALVYLEHSIQDARTTKSGEYRVVSKRMQFVEIGPGQEANNVGYAPYLDYRPATVEEQEIIKPLMREAWICKGLEEMAYSYAVEHLVPQHLCEVKERREELITKTLIAVKDRLTKEINYWDHRANELREQERAGKVNAKINSAKAQQRADDLDGRLQKRITELEQERRLSPMPPVVVGGALVVPQGYLDRVMGRKSGESLSVNAVERARVEQIAMRIVMQAEAKLGYEPRDVSRENCGYDIESRRPDTEPQEGGRLRFIEVKGRASVADTITITKNEILTGLNKPEDYILAIVLVDGDQTELWYSQKPFGKEPDFGAESVNYSIDDLLVGAEGPL